MNELVQHLSQGTHPIVVGGPQSSLEDLKNRLTNMNYVFIKFTDTRGGTDLGVRVDPSATDLSQANFEQGIGTVHVEGTLTLNYVKVLCIANIDLATLSGFGRLKVVE